MILTQVLTLISPFLYTSISLFEDARGEKRHFQVQSNFLNTFWEVWNGIYLLNESKQTPIKLCFRAILPKWMMACAEACTPSMDWLGVCWGEKENYSIHIQCYMNSVKLVIPLHIISWVNSFSDTSRNFQEVHFTKYDYLTDNRPNHIW